MSQFFFEPLGSHHDRSGFECGVPALDNYFRQQASQDQRKDAARVYVMVPTANPEKIAGFYTLSAASVQLTKVEPETRKRLARYPEVPAFLIGRLARDTRFPGCGSVLMADALERCLGLSETISAALVIVDAKDDHAAAFYKKFGFAHYEENRLFLPMATYRRATASA